MRNFLRFTVFLALATTAPFARGQTTVYSDDFNRSLLSGGTSSYTTTVSGGDGGASIINNTTLQLTNDASATTNAAGRVSVATDISALSGFNDNLSLNTGSLITWTFNMRYGRTGSGNTPSGFGGGNYGTAFVLGATGVDFANASTSGYALMFGNSGSPDTFRLVSFASGITTDITSPGAAGNPLIIGSGAFSVTTQAAANDYYSFQVTYNTNTNVWTLFGRDDGSSAFADPSSGSFTTIGSKTDTTYTNTALTNLGALWNYNTAANQTSQFDNFKLTLATIAAQNLIWNVTSGTWNKTATNWNGGTGTFVDGDNVSFTDAHVGNVTVDAAGVSPGTLSVSNTTGTYAFSGGAINGTAQLVKTGAGIVKLSSSNGFSGGIALNGGTVVADGGDNRLGASGGTLTFAGGTLQTQTSGITSARNIIVNAGGGTFDTNGFDSSTTGTTNISDLFTKSGSGNLTLSGNVTLSGSGALNIAAGSLTLAQNASTITQSNGGTYNGDLIITGTGGPRLNFGGNFSGSGRVLIASSGASLSTTGSNVVATISNNIVLSSTNAAGPFLTNIGSTSGNALTITGIISGASDVNFASGSSGGAGIVTLSGSNSYTGVTYINNSKTGVVRLGADNALPATTALNFGNGSNTSGIGAVDLNGHNLTIASLATLSGTSGQNFNGIANTGSLATITISGTANTTYAGTIGIASDITNLVGANDNIALVLSSSNTGTLKLTGNNTFIGGTTISGGTLLFGNGNVLSDTGAVTVNGGTLDYNGHNETIGALSGSINGTIQSSGTGGTLTTSKISLGSGVAFKLLISGTTQGTDYNLLATTGTANITGATLSVSLSNFTPTTNGTESFTVIDNQFAGNAVIGTFAGLAEGAQFNADGVQFQISYIGGDGNDVVLTAVPEPSTFVSIGLGGASLVALRKKRRSS